jgi:hypothetical protein
MKAAGHEANPLALGRFQAEHHEKAPSRKAGLSDMVEGLALLHGAADDERRFKHLAVDPAAAAAEAGAKRIAGIRF